MTALGIFSEEELELVSNIGFIIAPSERLGEGFTVQVIDGLRTWSCATKFGQIMVKGAPASFSGSYTLSPRFVRVADHLANWVTLSRSPSTTTWPAQVTTWAKN